MIKYARPLATTEVLPHVLHRAPRVVINRTLEEHGVIPTGSLTTNRQMLAWCKVARTDPPDVNVDGYFEVLRQHFHPTGHWQGFDGEVGIDPNNANENAQEADNAQGIGNAVLPFVNGVQVGPPAVNDGGAGANGVVQPAVVTAGVGTSQPRVSSVAGVNPLEALQRKKAEVEFQSGLLHTWYCYRPGEPNAQMSPGAKAFKECLGSTSNRLLKTGDLVAQIQPSGARTDFSCESLCLQGLLIYQVVIEGKVISCEYIGMLGKIDDWSDLLPLVKQIDCPLDGFGELPQQVLTVVEGPVKKALLLQHHERRKVGSTSSNGKFTYTIDDDLVVLRKSSDVEDKKYVVLQKRFTSAGILLYLSSKEDLLYQKPGDNYAKLIRQLEIQRKGTFCGANIFDSVQMEAYIRIYELKVVTSSLPYVTLHTSFIPPSLKEFFERGLWSRLTVMESGRSVLITALQRLEDWFVAFRGAALAGLLSPVVSILSKTQGPADEWGHRSWSIGYFIREFISTFENAIMAVATCPPDSVLETTGVDLKLYTAPVGAKMIIQFILTGMKPNVIDQVTYFEMTRGVDRSVSGGTKVHFSQQDDDSVSSRASSPVHGRSSSSTVKRQKLSKVQSKPATIHPKLELVKKQSQPCYNNVLYQIGATKVDGTVYPSCNRLDCKFNHVRLGGSNSEKLLQIQKLFGDKPDSPHLKRAVVALKH